MHRCLTRTGFRVLAVAPAAAPAATPRRHLAAARYCAPRPASPRRRWLATTAASSSDSVVDSSNMTVPEGQAPLDIKPQLMSVAPMMDWTDVYYRQLARLISRHTWLYTEMVVDQTLLHSPFTDRFLWFPPEQHPIVCQLGGSNPEYLAKAAKIVERYGYDEINLNCGCPSDRVAGAGCFGAAMMLQPELVAACCQAMCEAVSAPITVKCRLGVDSFDTYPELARFVRVVSEGSGVSHFLIHARKCLLKGLNPHQNRTVPPLRYEWVWALKRDFPHLDFSLNGGVLTLEEVSAALRTFNGSGGGGGGDGGSSAMETGEGAAAAVEGAEAAAVEGGAVVEEGVAAAAEAAAAAEGGAAEAVGAAAAAGGSGLQGILGVMVGRAAYNMPWDALADADRAVFGAPTNAATSRRQVLADYAVWADSMLGHWKVEADGHKSPSVRTLVKPLLGMFAGEPRGKKWRAAVDGALKTAVTVSEVLDKTLFVLHPETLDSPPRMLGALPARLAHYAPELPPTPEPEVRTAAGQPTGSSEGGGSGQAEGGSGQAQGGSGQAQGSSQMDASGEEMESSGSQNKRQKQEAAVV